MCSACSGDPEDPPEAYPGLYAEDASPLQAWWRETLEDDVEDVEEESGSAVQPPAPVSE